MINTPDGSTAQQEAACLVFLTGGDKAHTQHRANDGQQLQRVLCVKTGYKARCGDQTVETQTQIQEKENEEFKSAHGRIPQGMYQVDNCLKDSHCEQENTRTDPVQKDQIQGQERIDQNIRHKHLPFLLELRDADVRNGCQDTKALADPIVHNASPYLRIFAIISQPSGEYNKKRTDDCLSFSCCCTLLRRAITERCR